MFPVILTVPRLLHVMPRAVNVITDWCGPLQEAMDAYGILETRNRCAMFLATLAYESAELTRLEESFKYTPERLLAVFPKRFSNLAECRKYVAMGPEAIASRVYADRLGNGSEASGDGWTYRGRAGGLTFKANYMEASVALCKDADTLLNNPEFVALPEFGAACACWHFEAQGCSASADANDFDGVCDKTNIGHKTQAVGDSNGFRDRVTYLARAWAATAP